MRKSKSKNTKASPFSWVVYDKMGKGEEIAWGSAKDIDEAADEIEKHMTENSLGDLIEGSISSGDVIQTYKRRSAV